MSIGELPLERLARHSRRETMRGMIALAMATSSGAAPAAGEAKKRAQRRRRKRQRQQKAERRRRCLDACPSGCFRCLLTVTGAIVCDNGGDSVCDEASFCGSDADCGRIPCVVAFQLVGSADVRRLGAGQCDYPAGLCNSVVGCVAP